MIVFSDKKLKFFSVLFGLLVFSSFGFLTSLLHNLIYFPGFHASLFFDTLYGESLLSPAEISVPTMAAIFWGFLSYFVLKFLYKDVRVEDVKNFIITVIKWYLITTLIAYVLIFLGLILFAQILF